MLSFKTAHEYISKSSAQDIFKRVAIYAAWGEFKYQKSFGHDIIVTLAAAFSGPFNGFKKDPYEDHAIKDLLSITDWGWNKTWNIEINKWVRKYCKTQDDAMYFDKTAAILIQGKSDQIYNYLQMNTQNPPMTEQYFPELVPFGHMSKNNWPRI